MTEVNFSKTWSILGYHDTLKGRTLVPDGLNIREETY